MAHRLIFESAIFVQLPRPGSVNATCVVDRMRPISSIGSNEAVILNRRRVAWPKNSRRRFTKAASNKDATNTPKKDEDAKDAVQKMRSRLREASAKGNAIHSAWDVIWKEGLTPWDLGKPTPVLTKELEKARNSHSLDMSPMKSSLTALVPGCGSGHDLMTIAYHHDRLASKSIRIDESVVVGLEVSPTSLEIARKLTRLKLRDHHGVAPEARIELVHGDFFDNFSSWKIHSTLTFDARCGSNGTLPTPMPFDLIFDYTFFCALPPSLRGAWGKRISELLHPETGKLLTLMFPILPKSQATEMKGPPYPVTVQDYREALEPHGVAMVSEPYSSPDTVSARAGKELVCWWKLEKK